MINSINGSQNTSLVEFTPDKDSFGCNSVRSFIDNLEYFQSFEQILYNGSRLDFCFTNSPTASAILIVDVFELFKNKNIKFYNINIVVVETLRQVINLIQENRFDLSKEYIIFSESYWNESEYQWPGFNYTLVYISWEINDIKHNLANSSNVYHHLIDIDVPKKYNPQYDFLCLAGRGKDWRDVFIHKLKSKIDLSNSLTSYFGQSLGNSDLIELDIPYSRDPKNFEREFYSATGNFKHKYVLSYFTKPELFTLTKFSIIVETEAKYNEYHVTEKTLKCLVLGHPFVVIGTYRYLEFLQKLGFMTCGHLFSEQYDQIENLDNRMDAVIDIAKELQTSNNFAIADLVAMQSHNIRNLFKLKDKEIYKKFLKIFNERNGNKNTRVDMR